VARPLLDHDFLFVVGKGGVGKTTASAALALAAARRGKRVLVAMCNTRERLSHLLETSPIGSSNQNVLPGIDAVNMVPAIAIQEYGHMVLKVKRLYDALFGNRLVTAFLHGVPGLEAWSMLGKAYYHTKETTHGGRRYDLVIVDGPATGHALDMLRVPDVLTDVAPPGLLRREAEAAMELFRDPDRGGAVLVTLPEDMPTNEAIDLDRALREELRIPVQRLIVNGVLPELFSPPIRAQLERARRGSPSPSPIDSLLAAGTTRSLREEVQRESLNRLAASITAPRVELPYLFVPEFRHSAIESLSQALV
jgi:anion-transporting  ArsA/GET3 family ATPase